MKRAFVSAATLLAISLGLALNVSSQGRSTLEEIDDFTDKTGTLKFDLNASPGMKTARLKVKVNIETGRAEWKLLDPRGNVRLTGRGAGGRVSTDTGDLQPIAGVWKLEIELKNASGDYHINWVAR